MMSLFIILHLYRYFAIPVRASAVGDTLSRTWTCWWWWWWWRRAWRWRWGSWTWTRSRGDCTTFGNTFEFVPCAVKIAHQHLWKLGRAPCHAQQGFLFAGEHARDRATLHFIAMCCRRRKHKDPKQQRQYVVACHIVRPMLQFFKDGTAFIGLKQYVCQTHVPRITEAWTLPFVSHQSFKYTTVNTPIHQKLTVLSSYLLFKALLEGSLGNERLRCLSLRWDFVLYTSLLNSVESPIPSGPISLRLRSLRSVLFVFQILCPFFCQDPLSVAHQVQL